MHARIALYPDRRVRSDHPFGVDVGEATVLDQCFPRLFYAVPRLSRGLQRAQLMHLQLDCLNDPRQPCARLQRGGL
jgi:hypothetical protein